MNNRLLEEIRHSQDMSLGHQLRLTIGLSMPAIMAQLSTILMEYIDASMVGHLGAEASAAIGLVSTSVWLFGGVNNSVVTGYSVQVSHAVGAADFERARSILRQSIVSSLSFCLLILTIGASIAPHLPRWLGGNESICHDATLYFLIFIFSLPAWQLNYLGASMLRSTGNMRIPSMLNVFCCALDIIFNFILIFPSRWVDLGVLHIFLPGAGWGVAGAALGSVLAHIVTASLMLYFLFVRSPELCLIHHPGAFRPSRPVFRKAAKICSPMMFQHVIMCSAQICITAIVAPLGIIPIAANSFAIIAESLCYMPGYGIGDAATTLVGLCIGADRRDLTKKFAYTAVFLGMAVMTFMGVIMYIFAPVMMSLMTPHAGIVSLGAEVLRIEAFAEPMFAASIVSYFAFVGAGDTFKPFLMNVGSMWIIRISLAALLAADMGLRGVWIAMCIELCCRGLVFLFRLYKGWWLPEKKKQVEI